MGGEARSPEGAVARGGSRLGVLTLLGAIVGIGAGIFLSAAWAGSASASPLPEGPLSAGPVAQTSAPPRPAVAKPAALADPGPAILSPARSRSTPVALDRVAGTIGWVRSRTGQTAQPAVSPLLTLTQPVVPPELLAVVLPTTSAAWAPPTTTGPASVAPLESFPAPRAWRGATRAGPGTTHDLVRPAGPTDMRMPATPFSPHPRPATPAPDREVTPSGSHPLQALPPVALLLPVLVALGRRLPRNTAPRLRFDPGWASPG